MLKRELKPKLVEYFAIAISNDTIRYGEKSTKYNKVHCGTKYNGKIIHFIADH